MPEIYLKHHKIFYMRKIYTIGFIAFFTASIAFTQSNEVSIAPLKDNSIYEEGDLSNGAGEHLFTGVIKTGERRRALLAFDLNGVLPEGTTIV
jgi:hypothetical protein